MVVRVDEREGWVDLVVADRGPGIARAEQERIFERFERGGATGSIRGTGVGLWLVRQLAEAHGGSARVESVPGEGATFVVELPRVAPG